MVRIATALASLALALGAASAASAAQAAKESDGISTVDPSALDGLCYQLTVTASKGALPPAASGAGLKGWVLTFDNGKAVISIPNGGDAKCKFRATAANGSAEVQNQAGGNLPRAQGLAPKAGFVSVTLELAGEITDKGKSFTGHITWQEKDDKKNAKMVFNIVGAVGKTN